MAKTPTVTTVTSGYNSTATLNNNFTNMRDQFENTLSLDGSAPNNMQADLDMDGNNILNAGTLDVGSITIAGATAVPTILVPNWEGPWVTATAYVLNDIVSESGNTYICTEAHTSGTFSTDLSASKWELFASKGAAGAGTGDMLAANNLSDVAAPDTALANLGGGTTGIALFKDTTAAAARTELGLGTSAVANKTGPAVSVASAVVGSDAYLAEWNAAGDVVQGPQYLPEASLTLPATISSHTVNASESYLNWNKFGRTINIKGVIQFSAISGTIDANEGVLLQESWLPAGYPPLNTTVFVGGACGFYDSSASFAVLPCGWRSHYIATSYFGIYLYAPVAMTTSDKFLVNISYETNG